MADLISDFKNNLDRIVQELKTDFITLRGSRPTVKLVEDIKVEIYNQSMTVKQLGSISVVPPREINITAWDKNVVSAVSKAIETSLELNPSIDGMTIRVNMPPLTEERKTALIKSIGKMAEEARIKVRSFREHINKEIDREEEAKDISEDVKFSLKEKAQNLVKETNSSIEDLLDKKISDLTN